MKGSYSSVWLAATDANISRIFGEYGHVTGETIWNVYGNRLDGSRPDEQPSR